MALKTTLSIKVGIVILQEPFISNKEISYSRFQFYWLQKQRNNIRVMTAIKKQLIDKILVNHKKNLMNHPYFMVLEI